MGCEYVRWIIIHGTLNTERKVFVLTPVIQQLFSEFSLTFPAGLGDREILKTY